jgi:fused signal recognition particle receptor
MLKWFHRDKNELKTGEAPAADHTAVPAEAESVDLAAHATPKATVPIETPLAVADAAPTDAPSVASPVAPAALAAPVIDTTPPAKTAASTEEATPWWRYEGVWRKAKPPAPVVEAPAAPVLEAPTRIDPVPAIVVDAPSRPVFEAPSAPEVAPSVERKPLPAPAADSLPARGAYLAPEARVPSRPDPVATPAADLPTWRDPPAAADLDDQVPALFAPEAPTPQEPAPETAKPRSLRERLAATARALTASVGSLFKRNPKLDDDLLEELETALIQADVGVMASTELVAKLGVRMRKREFADAQALLAALRTDLRALIVNYARPLHIPAAPRPFVILTVGVNGAGKTTTIGKLAMRYKQAGHSVMLAAGDTFRAAAVEQLKTWGDRNQVAVIAQGSGADSASVIFDALQAAKSRGIDVLIADTAGRLHTQGHLMQELAKVKRVLGKIDPQAPHETLLVIDGGTGQNALTQAKQFHQAVGLTGIVVTKLDGTAKGGMVFALCRELGLPIRFIGVGEKREDLREFDAEDFVDALLPRELGG